MAHYPCQCTPCVGCVTPSPSCPDGNCLNVPSLVISAETSVSCGGSAGVVDLAALADLDACTGNVVWGLISYNTTAFSVAAVDSNGELSFTTTDDAVPGTFYTFSGVTSCDNSLLSVYWTVKVPIKVNCNNVICGPGATCNPCTGACVPNVPDVILT